MISNRTLTYSTVTQTHAWRQAVPGRSILLSYICAAGAPIIYAYNSCRNRHCPKCQGAAAREWLEERESELLPVHYFHVVFTLPAPIAAIAYRNKAAIYGILFKASAGATLKIAADPKRLGARIGITSAENVAKARELLAVPVPAKDPGPQNAEACEPDSHPRPCPCCGGRMMVIERFARGCTPRHQPSPHLPGIRIDTS